MYISGIICIKYTFLITERIEENVFYQFSLVSSVRKCDIKERSIDCLMRDQATWMIAYNDVYCFFVFFVCVVYVCCVPVCVYVRVCVCV